MSEFKYTDRDDDTLYVDSHADNDVQFHVESGRSSVTVVVEHGMTVDLCRSILKAAGHQNARIITREVLDAIAERSVRIDPHTGHYCAGKPEDDDLIEFVPDADTAHLRAEAMRMLAIAEQIDRDRAEGTKRKERRLALYARFGGSFAPNVVDRNSPMVKALDYAIELEDKLEAAK